MGVLVCDGPEFRILRAISSMLKSVSQNTISYVLDLHLNGSFAQME